MVFLEVNAFMGRTPFVSVSVPGRSRSGAVRPAHWGIRSVDRIGLRHSTSTPPFEGVLE